MTLPLPWALSVHGPNILESNFRGLQLLSTASSEQEPCRHWLLHAAVWDSRAADLLTQLVLVSWSSCLPGDLFLKVTAMLVVLPMS